MRLEIPFVGPAYKSESLILSPQECVNLYLRQYMDYGIPDRGEGFGSPRYALFGTPGMELYGVVGDNEIRGLLVVKRHMYVVCGDGFYVVSPLGGITFVDNLLTSSGRVGMETNGNDVIIVDGTHGYTYDLSTESFSRIVDPDFPGGYNVVFIDGYYLVNQPETSRIYRSDWNDGTSWSGLAFSTAGGEPDYVLGIEVDHRDVWFIGEYTTEIWYNTGVGEFNFARIDGAFIDQGGVSHFGHCVANNAVYWLGRDKSGQGQVFQSLGRQPKVISTIPITYSISQQEDLSDASMWSYQQNGHTFVVLTLPSSNTTWVYDSTTGFWHQRSSYVDGVMGKWRANVHAFYLGNHIVGDDDGRLLTLNTDVYTEMGNPIVAVRTAPVVRKKQQAITVDEVSILTEPAVGAGSGEAEDVDPKGMFSWSRDGGRNFSPEVDVSLGKIGEYESRPVVTQLGQGRNWVFRLRVSAAVKRVILGAYMEAEEDG